MATEKLWDRLQDLLYRDDPDLTLCVYRVDSDGKRQDDVRTIQFRTPTELSLETGTAESISRK